MGKDIYGARASDVFVKLSHPARFGTAFALQLVAPQPVGCALPANRTMCKSTVPGAPALLCRKLFKKVASLFASEACPPRLSAQHVAPRLTTRRALGRIAPEARSGKLPLVIDGAEQTMGSGGCCVLSTLR